MNWATQTHEDVKSLLEFCSKVFEQFLIERERTSSLEQKVLELNNLLVKAGLSTQEIQEKNIVIEEKIDDLHDRVLNADNLSQEAHVTAQSSINFLKRIDERISYIEEFNLEVERAKQDTDPSHIEKRLFSIEQDLGQFIDATAQNITEIKEAITTSLKEATYAANKDRTGNETKTSEEGKSNPPQGISDSNEPKGLVSDASTKTLFSQPDV